MPALSTILWIGHKCHTGSSYEIRSIQNHCTAVLDAFVAYCMPYCACVRGCQKAASRPFHPQPYCTVTGGWCSLPDVESVYLYVIFQFRSQSTAGVMLILRQRMGFHISHTSLPEIKLRGVGYHLQTVNALCFISYFDYRPKATRGCFWLPASQWALLQVLFQLRRESAAGLELLSGRWMRAFPRRISIGETNLRRVGTNFQTVQARFFKSYLIFGDKDTRGWCSSTDGEGTFYLSYLKLRSRNAPVLGTFGRRWMPVLINLI